MREDLATIVREAAAWCARRPRHWTREATIEADLRAHPLRSEELQPPFAWTGHERPGEGDIEFVVLRRRELLAGTTGDFTGRVMCTELDCSVWDGAAAHSSDSFFDEGDVPPWDTWLGLLPDGLLLSWVPAEYVRAAEAGFQVNPVDCIYWWEKA